jgi:hypothetical protein
LFGQSEKKLIKSDNPFAMAALTGLYYLKSGRNIKKTYELKVKLLRLLLSKGYSREKVAHLFVFLDTLLTLSEQKEKAFKEELMNITGGKEKMGLSPLDSPIAKTFYLQGHKEGHEEGKIETLVDGIKSGLAIKFGSESLAIMPLIEKIDDSKRLRNILDQIFTAVTLDEIKGLLQ